MRAIPTAVLISVVVAGVALLVIGWRTISHEHFWLPALASGAGMVVFIGALGVLGDRYRAGRRLRRQR